MTTSNSKTLIIAEHNNQVLNATTARTITPAKTLGEVDLLIVGFDCQRVVEEARKFEGIAQVISVDNAVYQHQLPENTAQLIAEIGKDYQYILAPGSTFGKNLMPRVAALLDVSQISDIVKIESADTFVRPIYAGNALATLQSKDPVKVITVRISAFDAAKTGENSASIQNIDQVIENALSTFVGQELTASERPELASARVVISGGRGLQSGENFKILEELADRLNAGIGASRAAVDAGYVPNDYQVGQTGKIVAPDLYIAVGISGAIQHLAGMKDSKVIVAINKDEDAPIFGVADYGLVGDLFDIVPKLSAELSKL